MYSKSLQACLASMSGDEASGGESESEDETSSICDNSEEGLVRNYELPVCSCDEAKCLKALKENEHVEDLESEFDSKDWKSSGYSSTDMNPTNLIWEFPNRSRHLQ